MFEFVTIASSPGNGCHSERLSPSFMYLLSMYLQTQIRSYLSLFCRLNSLRNLNLSSYEMSFVLRKTEVGTVHHIWLHKCRVEEKDHLLLSANNNFHKAAQDTIIVHRARPHCCLMLRLVSTRTSKSFSANLVFIWVSPSYINS